VPAHRYRITISGALGEVGREVFGDLRIEGDGANTVLTGDLDEAALLGVLNRVLVLGLELVDLIRLPERGKLSGPGARLPHPRRMSPGASAT
jgi:hypothetical protein